MEGLIEEELEEVEEKRKKLSRKRGNEVEEEEENVRKDIGDGEDEDRKSVEEVEKIEKREIGKGNGRLKEELDRRGEEKGGEKIELRKMGIEEWNNKERKWEEWKKERIEEKKEILG